MEIMIAWFWMVKAIVVITFILSMLKLYKSKFKNKFWWFMVILGFIMLVINPIKMKNISSHYNQQQNYQIEQQHKEVPEMQRDTSFNDSVNSVKGITEKDLK